MSLHKMRVGFEGFIKEIAGDPVLVERLYEIGFAPGESIELQSKVLFGDPIVVSIRGTSIALRKEEAQCIEVTHA